MPISVALGTYNGARHLRAQLDSILAQTLPPAEIVISDDGSSDDTVAIVEAFIAASPVPARLLRNTRNLGFSDNFLACAAACRQPLIAFADQDDVWLPDKLRMLHDRIVADDSLLAMHTLTTTDDALRPTGLWRQDIDGDEVVAPLTLFPYRGGWGNSMLFRAELLAIVQPDRRPKQPEEARPLSHDTWIYILAAAFGRISRIDTPLVLYRQHGSNASATRPRSAIEKLLMRAHLTMDRLRERQEFYASLADILQAARVPHDTAFAVAPLEAAQSYWMRRDDLARRTDVYYLARLVERWRAYRTQPTPLSAGGRVRDLVVGVSGLHPLLLRALRDATPR